MKEKILNIPDFMTLIRLLLAPFLFYFIIKSQILYAAGILFLALLSELDGRVARRLNEATNFGRIFDKSVDIIFISSGFIALILINIISFTEFLLIVGAKLPMLISRIIVYIKNHKISLLKENIYKVGTFSFGFVIFLLLLNIPYSKFILYVLIAINFGFSIDSLIISLEHVQNKTKT